MKSQTPNPSTGQGPGQQVATPTRQRLSRFRLRPRKKKEGVIQGKLRIKSLPGAFLVLGVVVVVVGTALAVAGYWPYRTRAPGPVVGVASEGQTAPGWGLGAKGLLSTTASLIHSERMKLLGPVIMGVGLFILICANTVLYENRDRETQMLLAQMRNVICSVSAAVPAAELTELAASSLTARHYQWLSSLPAAHLNILCLHELTSSEPLLHTRSAIISESDDGGGVGDGGDDRGSGDNNSSGRESSHDPQQEWCRRPSSDDESAYRQTAVSMLRTEVVHHQESASTPSIPTLSSDSCGSSRQDLAEGRMDPNSCTIDGLSVGLSPSRMSSTSNGEQRHLVEQQEEEETPPHHRHKLSNCLTASSSFSMSTIEGGDEWEPVYSAIVPRRSQSLSYRTRPLRPSHEVAVAMDDGASGNHNIRGPGGALRETGSEVYVNMGLRADGDELLELVSVEEEHRHRSWPRLDMASARRYLKLENKEDSVDKLLDQLELQCGQWDKNFGSGPFQ